MLSNIYTNERKNEEPFLKGRKKKEFDEGYSTSHESIELIFTSFNEKCNTFNHVERNIALYGNCILTSNINIKYPNIDKRWFLFCNFYFIIYQITRESNTFELIIYVLRVTNGLYKSSRSWSQQYLKIFIVRFQLFPLSQMIPKPSSPSKSINFLHLHRNHVEPRPTSRQFRLFQSHPRHASGSLSSWFARSMRRGYQIAIHPRISLGIKWLRIGVSWLVGRFHGGSVSGTTSTRKGG